MIKNLFNGNNKKGWELIQRTPNNWTTGPLEALGFALNIARLYDSEMMVAVLEDMVIDNYFRKVVATGCLDISPSEWYKCIKEPFRTVEERDKRIRIYSQNQLPEFLKQ